MIGAYQRYVSPYKGFRCAHHACTGGMTCSNFGKSAIREHGLWAALPRIRQRFIQCSEYATDPFKGKINADDPGPLKIKDECGACAAIGCTEFLFDLGCGIFS